MNADALDGLALLRAKHLVETDWLADQLSASNPAIRVVDMRGLVRTVLAEEGVQTAEYLGARDEYVEGHIPDAVYLDWTSDLVDETDPVPAQAAGAEKLRRILQAAGIGDEHLIVAYDAHPAAQFATRLWWLLRYHGHDNVRILNGGWRRWRQEGRPTSTDTPHYPPSRFTPATDPRWRLSADQVAALIGKPGVTIVDARDADQYAGRIRRGARGGHIPGALHLPREDIVTTDGTFKGSEELLALFAGRRLTPDTPVAAYCNGGVAATSVLFALSMVGSRTLSNYDGSWNEWAERADLPIESE